MPTTYAKSSVTDLPATESREYVTLPRLLYIGDVCVESSVGGPALLYRLLQSYRPDKLRIVEGGVRPSDPNLRLPEVAYDAFSFEFRRLLYTRFGSYYAAYLHLTATLRRRFLKSLIQKFKPEAILSVAYGYSWMTAQAVALELDLPLHLVLHDFWSEGDGLPAFIRNRASRQFESTYREAATRLCVSRYMAEFYQRKFNVSADVLPPSRPVDMPTFSSPPKNSSPKRARPVFAFAGSIANHHYAKSLVTLASVLEAHSADLLIYSDISAAEILRFGLDRDNVTVRSQIPYLKLVKLLRQETDVLFVPMSFGPEDRTNMEISFPSKLSDYSATGLPILIWGPAYCSAVRWAKENHGVAAIVETNIAEDLGNAVYQLLGDAKYRHQLGRTALTVGNSFFSHSHVTKVFHQAVGIQG